MHTLENRPSLKLLINHRQSVKTWRSATAAPRGLSRRSGVIALLAVAIGFTASVPLFADEYKSGIKWLEPKIITPGTAAARPPTRSCSSTAKTCRNGRAAKSGRSKTATPLPAKAASPRKQSFGDCQLHVEWATPVEGLQAQGRGAATAAST